MVEQVVELGQAGLRRSFGGFAGVLAQHAEQAPHLGQSCACGVTDRGEPARSGGRQSGGGESGSLGLDGDHGNVVGYHVVQLAGDPGAFASRGVLEQGACDDLSGGVVFARLAAGPARDPGPGCRRGQPGQQHRQECGLGVDGPRAGESEQQERDGQKLGQVGLPAAVLKCPRRADTRRAVGSVRRRR